MNNPFTLYEEFLLEIQQIQTKIDGLDVGDMIVTWDMSYTYDIPEDAHPDNPAPGTCETRDVEQVYNIELRNPEQPSFHYLF